MATPSMTTPPRKRQQQMMRYTSPSVASAVLTGNRHPRGTESPLAHSHARRAPATVGGDRFIPSRRTMNVSLVQRSLRKHREDDNNNDNIHEPEQKKKVTQEFRRHLLSSLCDVPVDSIDEETCEPKQLFSTTAPDPSSKKKSTTIMSPMNPFAQDSLRVLSHLDQAFARGGSRQGKHLRGSSSNLPEKPYRILSAPFMANDYYSKLVSWGANNIVAVALDTRIFVHDPVQSVNSTLDAMDFGKRVTCVEWCPSKGWTHLLAAGYSDGRVCVYDTTAMQFLYDSELDHMDKVTTCAWSGVTSLTTGSRDCSIVTRDVVRGDELIMMEHHSSTVVNLKWNPTGNVLASGGNDDIVCLWDLKMMHRNATPSDFLGSQSYQPRSVLTGHAGAVRAIAWCPLKPNVLASGGGYSDQTIKLWNTDSATLLSSTKANAQVTDLRWDPHCSRSLAGGKLLSAHGYSCDSAAQMALWNYQSANHELSHIHSFSAHEGQRVHNIELSADGCSLMTNGQNETLEFWNIFKKPTKAKGSIMGEHILFDNCIIR